MSTYEGEHTIFGLLGQANLESEIFNWEREVGAYSRYSLNMEKK
jgi:hypothetical protein